MKEKSSQPLSKRTVSPISGSARGFRRNARSSPGAGSEKNLGKNPDSWYISIMDRAEAIARLREHKTELERLGVQHLYLFGSMARDEARKDSDIDLFFDYEKGKLGLFELMDVKEAASRILGCRTDIMTRDSLHKAMRRRIEAAAVPVF
jgi:predicted nucleotidyltransferase